MGHTGMVGMETGPTDLNNDTHKQVRLKTVNAGAKLRLQTIKCLGMGEKSD